MKKLLCVVLLIAWLLPISAIASERDRVMFNAGFMYSIILKNKIDRNGIEYVNCGEICDDKTITIPDIRRLSTAYCMELCRTITRETK